MTIGALASLLGIAACAQSLADGSYPGQPLAKLNGTIQSPGGDPGATHPYLGLVWTVPDANGGPLAGTPKLIGELTPVTATSFPVSFKFDLFDPPPAAAISNLPNLGLGAFAIAFVTAIDDVNDDGRFDVSVDTVSYNCPAGVNFCLPPDGQIAATGGTTTCHQVGSAPATCTSPVLKIAAPDRLLGSAPTRLIYTQAPLPAGANSLPILNLQDLAVSGYHPFDVCDFEPSDPRFAAFVQAHGGCSAVVDGGTVTIPCQGGIITELRSNSTPVTITLDGKWPTFPLDATTLPPCAN